MKKNLISLAVLVLVSTPSSTLGSAPLAEHRLNFIYDDCAGHTPSYGLLSKRTVTLNGAGTYTTSVYGESAISAKSGGMTLNGDLTSLGSIDEPAKGYTGTTSCKKGGGCDNDDPAPVPVKTPQQVFNGDPNTKDANNKEITAIDCSKLSGDLKGKTYMCNPPAKKNDSIDLNAYNGTLYYMQGASSDTLDINGGQDFGIKGHLTIITTSGITFNGSGTGVGAFVTGGDFTYNGKRDFKGSIVAQGDITVNGASTFEYNDADNPAVCNIQATLQ